MPACRFTFVAFAALSAALALAQNPPTDANWPQFRGPAASGIGGGAVPSDSWNAESGANIRWKTALPGLGLSSPVVWGDRIFVTTAVGDAEQSLRVGLYGDVQPVDEAVPYSFRVLCVDRKSGAIVWDQEAHRGVPKIKRHTKASHANSTPATDGRHVVAFFGSEGLYCYDVDGKLLWKKDLGLLDSGWYTFRSAQWGFGSSPVIVDERVIIQCDVQEGSYLAALDIKDGREIWRTDRNEVPTWSTPAVHRTPTRSQIICNGWRHIGGYDLETGKELWLFEGGGDIPVPTPVVAHGLAFITNAHGAMAPIYAIKLDAEGEIVIPEEGASGRYVQWFRARAGNYMQTPLIVGDLAYFCRDNGILTAYRATTGDEIWKQRLGGGNTGFTGSGVASGDRLFFTSEEGDTYVLKAGEKYELIAKNSIGEYTLSTPAVSDGLLLLRGHKHLFAVGAK